MACRINAVNDERINLALNLMIDPQIGVKTPWVILGLHFAGDVTFLVAAIKARDPACARLAGDQIGPDQFHFRPKGCD